MLCTGAAPHLENLQEADEPIKVSQFDEFQTQLDLHLMWHPCSMTADFIVLVLPLVGQMLHVVAQGSTVTRINLVNDR